MPTHEFKEQDRVVHNYLNGHGSGTVIEVRDHRHRYPYIVQWDNGHRDRYCEQELAKLK